jgi:hypothetical protein
MGCFYRMLTGRYRHDREAGDQGVWAGGTYALPLATMSTRQVAVQGCDAGTFSQLNRASRDIGQDFFPF